MTTIACIEGPEWVMIGADSQSSSEDGFSINIPNGKIFRNNSVVFAMAGSVRGINILEHDYVPPQVSGKDIDKYVTRQLIPSIRKSFMAALAGGLVDDPAKARKIVTKALQIASKYDAYTGGKITVSLIQESK